MVDKIKVPDFDEYTGVALYWDIYSSDIVHNDGFYWRNCETDRPNHECYYLEKGCDSCLRRNTDNFGMIIGTGLRALNKKIRVKYTSIADEFINKGVGDNDI